MTESIKMIEFGPEGPRVVEVFAPPVLAVDAEPRGPSNWEIAGYILAGFAFTGSVIYLVVWWIGTW